MLYMYFVSAMICTVGKILVKSAMLADFFPPLRKLAKSASLADKKSVNLADFFCHCRTVANLFLDAEI